MLHLLNAKALILSLFSSLHLSISKEKLWLNLIDVILSLSLLQSAILMMKM